MNPINFRIRSRLPRTCFIVFTRYPEAGKTKTRMIPALGTHGAADLQRQMTVRAVRQARLASMRCSAALQICYEGGDTAAFQSWLGADLDFKPQDAGNLGERLESAFINAFQDGGGFTFIVGSDIPEMNDNHMLQASEALKTSDIVLGPTADGGYYLIGLKRNTPELFQNIPWGSEDVFSETMRRARSLDLKVSLLEVLDDVDRPADLDIWDKALRQDQRSEGPHLSVIIPTLNEAQRIGATLASAMNEQGVEVIVVDGGSEDATCVVARNYGAKVVKSRPGRARQMNAGASVATGDILLFLHADTMPPRGYADSIRQALQQPETIAGAFRFRLDVRSAALSIVEGIVKLRCAIFHEPYGDQGLFLRAETFRELCGYEETPLLEDVKLIRRLKRVGRIKILSDAVSISARRWTRIGVMKTFLLHSIVILAFNCGVKPSDIVSWLQKRGYYSSPRPRPSALPNSAASIHDNMI